MRPRLNLQRHFKVAHVLHSGAPTRPYFTALSPHYKDFTVLRRAFLSWSYSQSIFQYYHPREIDFQNS